MMLVTGNVALGAATAATGGPDPDPIPTDDQCAQCHHEMDEAFDVAFFFDVDVHARAGLSCADCHGGDASSDDEDAAMSEAAGFIGAPGPLAAPDFCARCHSDPTYMRRHEQGLPVDQLILYRTSVHGMRNAEGDRKVATCVSCHGAHEIRRASESKSPVHPLRVAETCGSCHSDDKLMGGYGLPTDQVEEYLTSVHANMLVEGGDLSAPTCNDCHGNHGAYPPEVESVSDICGQCHVHNREYYQSSPKRAIFADLDLPACETCHGNHAVLHPADDWVGLGEETTCSECHDDDGSEPALAIMSMRATLDSLRVAVHEGEESLKRAHEKGMYIGDAEYEWSQARQKLLETRTTVHTFDPVMLAETAGEGLTLARQVQIRGEEALSEFRWRRTGLLIATLVITLLALALWAKIRQLERG
jgi:hypothetical protein